MEYQEVEKNEHPIHKQGQPSRAVGKVKQKYDHGNGGRGNQKYGEPVEGAVRLKLFSEEGQRFSNTRAIKNRSRADTRFPSWEVWAGISRKTNVSSRKLAA